MTVMVNICIIMRTHHHKGAQGAYLKIQRVACIKKEKIAMKLEQVIKNKNHRNC